MKTKFSAILDVRHKALQSHERKMMQHNLLIAQKQTEIDAFMHDIAQVQFPKIGDFGAYLALADTRDRLLGHVDTLHAELSQLKSQAKALREEYKTLHIEYEKIKYLDTKEQESKLKAIKITQDKELDEISIILHRRGVV
ncbi:flagellar export protein FliJ [uncultured Helicobacter sp.]|uniref:flagellar export protein FliJ n=1 Tax=uncultured Helicobacter sp. TaxID=175537 RepID=UPI00374F88C1